MVNRPNDKKHLKNIGNKHSSKGNQLSLRRLDQRSHIVNY